MRKLLLSLFVCVVGFVSFGYCQNTGNLKRLVNSELTRGTQTVYIYDGLNETYNLQGSTNYYLVNQDNKYYSICFSYIGEGWNFLIYYSSLTINASIGGPNCFLLSPYGNSPYDISFQPSSYDASVNVKVEEVYLSQLNSLECQTEYNLIPIEDVDINYCVGNQLCPNESGTGDFSGDLQFSNIYINDILHPGKQNIFVNIPDYIMWDYNVVGDDFNIYVGSGYDVDYINSVIDINSYRPTSSDFTNVFVGGLTLIFPYIVIVLFIVFLRKLIKRIFK